MKNQNYWRSTWSTVVYYVDRETNEILTENTANQYYIIIKTTKNAQRAKFGTGGIITITKWCKRNPQQELPFTNE